ncbi:MAG: TetR/AcrR family transcriptional regulator [Desulfosarcinaceae bacterium]
MNQNSTFQQLRRDERKARKKLIVDAAMSLFETKPMASIGMRDIADVAGISPAAIYRYFPSRDEILVEALIRHIHFIEARLEGRLEQGNATLEELALGSIEYLLNNESLFQLMGYFMINGQINPQALEKFNTVQRYFLSLLDQVNQKAGIGQDSRLFTHAFYASILGVVMAFRNYPGRSQEEIQRHIYRLIGVVSSVFSSNGMAQTPPGENADETCSTIKP